MKSILVVSQDAGGAEMLSSMIRSERHNYIWSLVVPADSPAFSIFQKKGLADLVIDKYAEHGPSHLIDRVGAELLFCSTGWWNIELENSYIKEAKKKAVKTVSFIDHWVYYRERFGYPGMNNWRENLPDYLAVSDKKAYDILLKEGLGEPIRIKNYYFRDVIDEYNALKSSDGSGTGYMLLLSEPAAEHALKNNDRTHDLGYTEHGLIEDIMINIETLKDFYSFEKIVIRRHPAEDEHKYDYLNDRYRNVRVEVEDPKSVTLISSIRGAKIVIGFESMPLFISYLVKKPFISYLPVSKKCSAPLPAECCVHDVSSFTRIDFQKIDPSPERILFGEEHNLGQALSSLENRRMFA